MVAAANPPTPGVYTPSPTFFKKNGKTGREEVDIETQVKHTIFLADNGIKGVVLLGSTGEMIHMTRKERIDFVAGVKKGLQEKGYGSYPVLAGVAHNGVEDSIEECKAMKEAGAEYAMVLAPNYFAGATSQEGLVAWFNAVADESPLPVIIYYFPGVSNNLRMTPKTFEKLAAHPNIVGTKLSHGNVSEFAQIALNPAVQQSGFSTMTGLGQILVPAMTVGITGTIDAVSGALPKTLVKLYELGVAGKVQEAQKIQYTVARIADIIGQYGPVGTKHLITKVLGYGNPSGRAPLNVDLTAAQAGEYEDAINAGIALEKTL